MLTIDEATRKNKRLIWSIANRYRKRIVNTSLELGDVFGLASIGFVKAFNNFDPDRYDVKFSTYAVPMMAGEIQRFLRDQAGDLKFSRSVIDLAYKITLEDMESEPIETLMLHFDEDEVFLKKALYFIYNKKARSMQSVVYQDNGENITLEDQVGNQDLSDFTSINVNEFLQSLDTKERKIIELTMEGQNQKYISKQVGVSQPHVSRILIKLQSYVEEFFGYPAGYFKNRPPLNTAKEKLEMNKKIKKPKARSKKGDIELAKELLKTTNLNPSAIAKQTGVNDGSAYYWAKKIREPEQNEPPVTITKIDISKKAEEEKEVSTENKNNAVKVELGVPAIKLDGVIEAEVYDYGKAVQQAEEKRQSVLNNCERKFNYSIHSQGISSSEIHTIFTQVGHAASASGIEKLNVNVAVSSETI